jgi:hypothetical protein
VATILIVDDEGILIFDEIESIFLICVKGSREGYLESLSFAARPASSGKTLDVCTMPPPPD